MEISEKDYELAISMVQKYRNTSLSYLQRKLGWGFARAYAAMCRMEKEFVVGPLMLSGRREAYPIEMHQLWKELQKAKAQEVPEGFVLIDQKNVENWYLDENESIWWEHDGIDNTLCDLPIGRVEEVHHKEFLIIKNNSLFAAIAWDEENNQPGTWEFFETKEKANEVASYCKSMNEAQEQSHD